MIKTNIKRLYDPTQQIKDLQESLKKFKNLAELQTEQLTKFKKFAQIKKDEILNLKNKVFMFNTKKNKKQIMMEDMDGNFDAGNDANALTGSNAKSNGLKSNKNQKIKGRAD